METNKKTRHVQCPHCDGVISVNDYKWTAIKCLYCQNFVNIEEFGNVAPMTKYMNSDGSHWSSYIPQKENN